MAKRKRKSIEDEVGVDVFGEPEDERFYNENPNAYLDDDRGEVTVATSTKSKKNDVVEDVVESVEDDDETLGDDEVESEGEEEVTASETESFSPWVFTDSSNWDINDVLPEEDEPSYIYDATDTPGKHRWFKITPIEVGERPNEAVS